MQKQTPLISVIMPLYNADDLCSPERFAKQLAFFERHPQTDICGSYYTMFGTRGGGK